MVADERAASAPEKASAPRTATCCDVTTPASATATAAARASSTQSSRRALGRRSTRYAAALPPTMGGASRAIRTAATAPVEDVVRYVQPTSAATVSQSPVAETSFPPISRRYAGTWSGPSAFESANGRCCESSRCETTTMKPIIPKPIRRSPTENALLSGSRPGSAKTSPRNASVCACVDALPCCASIPAARAADAESGITPRFIAIAMALRRMPTVIGARAVSRRFARANQTSKPYVATWRTPPALSPGEGTCGRKSTSWIARAEYTVHPAAKRTSRMREGRPPRSSAKRSPSRMLGRRNI